LDQSDGQQVVWTKRGAVSEMLRIAVACSGLGHIQRGIEAWAGDLAHGLNKAGVAVTLFGGAPAEGVVAVPCLRRTGATNQSLSRFFRHAGGWRYGAGSPYEIEQTSFSLSLWSGIRRGYDILHVQDPQIARFFETTHRRGLLEPRVIYANGTGEDGLVMRRFRNLQLLTSEAREQWRGHEPAGQSVFTIPNFVDTATFTPGDRSGARTRFGLPSDKIIVLCCAAIRKFHKRIDYLLTEFAAIARSDVMLVIAGGREADTAEIIAHGTSILGDRVRFLPDVPRADMPELYRAADLFALASLHEMFGIVLIEALASGLPVVCHDTASFRAIVGAAGHYADASAAGGLAAGITSMLDEEARSSHAREARMQAEHRFSETAVIPQMIAMYRSVLASPPS
jgi:1,2-diacylglycerol 3-alpha-glucosyltransferase